MLTAREIDVIYLLSRGFRYATIAQHLGISVHTVGTHLNWGATLPTVYRGPYEYSSPESRDDFLPQSTPPVGAAGARRH